MNNIKNCFFVGWTLQLLLPMPALSADRTLLQDTGQRQCYNLEGTEISCPAVGQALNGQDGQYHGVPPIFEDNGDQTVSDLHSGLVWMNLEEAVQHTWEDAISYCSTLSFAGHDDWRLPRKSELESIVDYGEWYPALDPLFHSESLFYWSSTPHVANPEYAWSVFSPDGADHWVHKSNNYSVRCVRAENTEQNDPEIPLEWQKRDNGTAAATWENALAYCENLSADSKTDWRLPNIRELKSLADYGRHYPAAAPEISISSSNYWSSTTVAGTASTAAWVVFFGNGDDLWREKTTSCDVRCVRGGLPQKK